MNTERMDRLMPAVTHMADGGIALFLLCALFMMRETTRILALSILIFLEICAVFSAPVKYVPYNVVFYYILVYLRLKQLYVI